MNEESFASISKKRPRIKVPSYPKQLPFVINFVNVGSVLGACSSSSMPKVTEPSVDADDDDLFSPGEI